MDPEQEGDQSEVMTVDADGPFNSTDDTSEICGGHAAATTTSNPQRTETDVAMEGTELKQHAKEHKNYKVRRGSSPLPLHTMN
jgi:hypothetical protein